MIKIENIDEDKIIHWTSRFGVYPNHHPRHVALAVRRRPVAFGSRRAGGG